MPQKTRNKHIEFFVGILERYVKSLIEKYGRENLVLSYIPSSSKVPDEIAEILCKKTALNKIDFISINEDSNKSKNIEDFYSAIENAKNKYVINQYLLNPKKTYIIVDDIFGVGASIVRVLDKLYEVTKRTNFFLILAKDVKRWV